MQVSIIVPLLKWATHAHIIFYGHFPDLHLAARASRLRRAYRRPFDALEAASTSAAHTLLVNSRFTLDTFTATFPRLAACHTPRVLYPAVAVPSDEELAADDASWESGVVHTSPPPPPFPLLASRLRGMLLRIWARAQPLPGAWALEVSA